MKIIKTDGVYSLARVENCTGWYWCSDYACGDLYEAEELFRDGHPVRQNRLIFVKYPEGRVVEPVKASEGQYFGAPVFTTESSACLWWTSRARLSGCWPMTTSPAGRRSSRGCHWER